MTGVQTCALPIFDFLDFLTLKMSSVNEEIIAPFESEKIKKIKRQEKIEKIDSGLDRKSVV